MAEENKTALLEGSTGTPPPPKLSYEEFLAQTSDGTWAEWVNGEVMYLATSKEHQNLGGFLLSLLQLFVEASQLGEVFYEPFQMKTGPDLPGRAPDVFFVAQANLSRVKQNYLDGPADLVVEIISPESRTRDRKKKFAEYQRGGVREYWLLDPSRRRAEFFQLEEPGRYRLVPADEEGIYRSAVLEGLWLKVEWLWQEPLPSLLSVLKAWGLV